MRGVFIAMIVVVGLAMVGVGGWGVYSDVTDDEGGEDAADSVPKTSSAEDCAVVARRDPRFRAPHDLQFGSNGKATVKCDGETVTFTIELEGLESGTFYDVLLERRRRREEVGSFLAVGNDSTIVTVTVPPEVRLRRYDFLTVEESDFGATAGETKSPAIRAAL